MTENTLDLFVEKAFQGLNDLCQKEKIKHVYVVDTNIIHNFPESIRILAQETEDSKNGKEPNIIVISDISRRELNGMKKSSNIEKAIGARVALKGLEEYTIDKKNKPYKIGDFNLGVKFPRNSYLIFMPYSENPKLFPKLRPGFKGDDQIISVALALKKQLGNKGEKVKIISDDKDMRTSCFQFDLSSTRFEEFYKDYDYTGFVEIELNWNDHFKLCQNLSKGNIPNFKINTIKELTDQPIHPNEFISFIAPNVRAKTYFRVDYTVTNAHLSLSNFERFRREKQESGVKSAYNPGPEQECALELLYDPNIDYITLSGPPGGGKTILPLDVGLHMLNNEQIYSMLVSSPPIVSNIGYLPGTKDDKLRADNAKIFDALRFLLGENERMRPNKENKNKSKNKKEEKPYGEVITSKIESYIQKQQIQFEALSFIKGRTLANKLILFDETEDYDPRQMRKLVSRLGKGSKMVFCGDPYQVDNPRCSKTKNGLVKLISDLRGLPNYAHITLKNNYRHPRAEEAIKRLSR